MIIKPLEFVIQKYIIIGVRGNKAHIKSFDGGKKNGKDNNT